ncbi:hypothetical protein [Cohnella terricola]|uniref:Uncharacterized protein n=1 Tax=Cohnella terricola TaxID=1289167 RepID=A0A559J8A6_9BACL|nr:hypothetical protein [Cohnella terricola]TVX96077.1 hypothetical protein FPZ45_21865 [Cohnella terricola]
MKKGLGIIFVVMIMLLSACSSSEGFKKDAFSEKDLCIVKVNKPSKKVCYGDSKDSIEKVIGDGVKKGLGIVEYDFGVSVGYRDEIAAAIWLNEESKGVFKTARGAVVGTTKEKVKELYGEKYGIDKATYYLDYFYDNTKKKYLDSVSVENLKVPDAKESTYMISFVFNDEGANRIFISDLKWAMILL